LGDWSVKNKMQDKDKKGIASNGQPLHFSVGAVIKKDDKYLMIDRVNPPFGFAGLAGHVDEGELPENTIVREVEEESGLKVLKSTLLFEEEILWNYCIKVPTHRWYLYECEVGGEVRQNTEETKSIGWYTKEELENLELESVWRYWFEKMGVISKGKK